MNNRLINTKVAGGGGGCTDIVDNYDPFGGNGVALYQLNGNATDVSGNYNATFTNPSYTTGVFGQAANFDTTSRYITTPYSYNWSGAAWTLSFWAKVNTAQDRYIMGTSQENGLAISARSSGVLFLIGAGNVPISYNLGEWKHFVYTYDGINNVKAYGNGVQVANQTVSITNLSDAIVLGKYGVNSGSNTFFNGSIDQFRVFDTELTPLEVEALYTEELCICDGTVDTLDILGDGSCIATYPLDGNANDLSGNYSGTPTDVSYGVGEFDLAGVFNGSSSYIDTSISTLSSTFSVSMWINEVSLGSGGFFGNWNATANDDMFWRTQPDGSLRINFDGAANQYFGSAGDITANNWHHIVVTFNNGTINVYADGNNKGSTTTINTTFNSGANFYIGDDNSATFFNGSIDQVRIFNKALSAGEVTTLYNETACTKAACTGTTNTLDILGDGSCIAAYPLDGSPADLSGNYNGVQGGVTYPQGYFDLAGSFNGSTSYVTLPITQSNDISISAWVKIEDLTRQHQIVSYDLGGVSSSRCLQFRVEFDQTVSAYWFSGTKVVSTSSLSQGVWAHVVATWQDIGTQKIYFNGVEEGSNPATTRPNFPNLFIGKRSISGGTVDDFLGSIDQVRIFNKSLSAGEVTTLYNETPCN